MKLRLSVTIISITTWFSVDAQKMVKHYNILWASYVNNIQLNTKWSVTSDVQVRTTNWANQWLLYAIRTSMNYSFNTKLTTGAGFALFKNAVYNKTDLLFFKNEWRPWQELAYVTEFQKSIILSQRIRTEERFQQLTVNNKRTLDYQFIFRFRYRFNFLFPVTKTLGVMTGDEIFVNPGCIGNSSFFDQNRTFAGVSIKIDAGSTFEAQYIKIYQWRNNTSVLEDQNAIRLNYIQKFSPGKHSHQNPINE